MNKTIHIYGSTTCAACKTAKSVAETGKHPVEYHEIDTHDVVRMAYELVRDTFVLPKSLPLVVVIQQVVDEQTNDVPPSQEIVGTAAGLNDSLALIRAHKE